MEREQQYVGIDLHRRRSVIVRMNDAGEVLGVSKIDNDPLSLSMALAEAGPDPEVVLEAHLALITIARKLARRCYHTLRNAGDVAYPAAA